MKRLSVLITRGRVTASRELEDPTSLFCGEERGPLAVVTSLMVSLLAQSAAATEGTVSTSPGLYCNTECGQLLFQ